MRKGRIVLPLLAVCIGVLLVAGGCAKGGSKGGATAAAASTTTAAKGAASASGKTGDAAADPSAESKHVEAFGIVKADTVHALSLEFPAVLQKRLVSEGQRVHRGDALFRFSRRDYDAQVTDKGYELTLARLDLSKAERDLAKLREDLAYAREDADKAQKDASDKERLLSLGAASRRDVEDAQRTLSARQKSVRELERAVAEYDSDVNGLEAQKTHIAILEEELARLTDLAHRPFIAIDTVICDLREAVVSDIGYVEGDSITRDKKLCTLIDLDSVIVEANVPEEFYKDVKVGSAASVVPVADTTRRYEGTVTRVSNLATLHNGETVVPVQIKLAAPDAFLLPNFNVDVSIY